MRILILGAGRMGSWFAAELSRHHEVAVADTNPAKLERLESLRCVSNPKEAGRFRPELLLNAVSLPQTREAFQEILPCLPPGCLLADVASVKTGLADYYPSTGHPFVSSHPMFGPTFGRMDDLREEHVILIQESHPEGKTLFKDFYRRRGLQIHEFTFEEHDQTIAYSLSVPFVASLVFAACMQPQDAPGTTFRRHLETARGLLEEDDHLLAEVLFNPHTVEQIERISGRLTYLSHIIRGRDREEMVKFLARVRRNLCQKPER